MKKIIIVAFLIIVLSTYSVAFGANWYVDNQATGTNNGTSWANAWTSFAKIVWGATGVKAGDTLYISGGSSSQTYNERISPKISGTAGMPITIQVGQDYGHNGKVIIDLNYDIAKGSGIYISGTSFIKVSGQVGTSNNCNILVTRSYYNGISLAGSVQNIEVSYVEATGNGYIAATHGILVSVTQQPNIGAIHHCIIHDNYDDEVWLYASANGGTASAFGAFLFYNNEIYDWHADAVKMTLGGVDFYNNIIRDRGIYKRDHPDGIQFWSSFVRISNNTMYNFIRTDTDINANSYIRYNPGDQYTGDLNPRYVYIYNNVFYETRAPQAAGMYFRGIEIAMSPATLQSINYIYVVNNTIQGTPFTAINIELPNTLPADKVTNIVIQSNTIRDACRKGVGSAVMILGKSSTLTYGTSSIANVLVNNNQITASSTVFLTDVSYGGTIMNYATFKTVSGLQQSELVTNISLPDPGMGTSYTITTVPTVTTTTAPTVTTTTAPAVTTTTAPKVTTTTTTKPKSTRGGWTIK